jgi:hypothetical protein
MWLADAPELVGRDHGLTIGLHAGQLPERLLDSEHQG